MATIRKKGTKHEVQIRRKGQRPISKSFTYLDDAKRWARAMEAKADTANLPDMRVLQTVTLGELVTRYREEVTPRHRGHEAETAVLTAFLRDNKELCAKLLSHLSQQDFAAYRDKRLKVVSPATVRRQLVPLKHMFKVARNEWGYPVANPLAELALQHMDNKRNRRLREGELERLLSECREYLPLGRIILFAVETGLRRGEILNVRYRDIDWKEPSVYIPSTKNGHSRTVPLSPKALEQITPSVHPDTIARFPPNELVFDRSANAIRLAWRRLTKRAGIEGLRFHDLRHEAISRFFEAGLTVPEVALLSGHRTMAMLSRYSHPQRKAILAKLGTVAPTPGGLQPQEPAAA